MVWERVKNQLDPMLDWSFDVKKVHQKQKYRIASAGCTSWTGWIFCIDVLTLSQRTNFRLFPTERVCRQQFQIWWKWQKVLQMGRKHSGKRRICSLQAISPFPTMFSEDLYWRHVKMRGFFGEGLDRLLIEHNSFITAWEDWPPCFQ